jgi:hypothetical protein
VDLRYKLIKSDIYGILSPHSEETPVEFEEAGRLSRAF